MKYFLKHKNIYSVLYIRQGALKYTRSVCSIHNYPRHSRAAQP